MALEYPSCFSFVKMTSLNSFLFHFTFMEAIECLVKWPLNSSGVYPIDLASDTQMVKPKPNFHLEMVNFNIKILQRSSCLFRRPFIVCAMYFVYLPADTISLDMSAELL